MNIITTKLGNGTVITKHYDEHSQLHCDNGPAVMSPTSKEWYKHGIKHNIDGYAVFINDKNFTRMEWWKEGKLHRINKPAIVDTDGTIEYWEEGRRIK